MSATNKKQLMNLIHVALMLLMMVGGAFLPTLGSITPLGMKTLGIFFGTVYGWSTLGMVWPSQTAKSIIRWRSYPSSVGYAATFSPDGEGFCYLQKLFSLHTRFRFIDRLKRPSGRFYYARNLHWATALKKASMVGASFLSLRQKMKTLLSMFSARGMVWMLSKRGPLQ